MAITDLDPKLLVEAHNGGDDHAFAQIVRTHGQGLFAHACSRLHDVQAAEDAVQETFVRAYRAMPSFDGDFHLRAWLHRILTNVCHDEGSRRQRDGLLIDLVSGQEVGGGDAADVDIERLDVRPDVVAEALGQLSESYREALVLRYVEELSYQEVAAATGVTEGNARVRVMRGRVALKRVLTSSHAVVLCLLPWLRRGGPRPTSATGLEAIGAASASPGLVAGSPTLLSAPLLLPADAGPQLAERLSTLPQVIGMVASLAVPVAAPSVADPIADWVSRPAPVTAAPAAGDLAATTTLPTPTEVTGPPRPADRPPTSTGPVLASTADSHGAGASPSGPVAASAPAGNASTSTSTAEPGVVPPTAPAPAPPTTAPTAQATSTTTSTTPAPPTPPAAVGPSAPATGRATVAPTARSGRPSGAVPAPPVAQPAPSGPAPAASVPFATSLVGDRITRAGEGDVELAGPVAWGRDAGSATSLDLRATLHFEPPPAAATVDGTIPPPPHPFAGVITLSLEDGRTYTLVLRDAALEVVDGRTPVSGGFELRDPCDSLVAAGTLTGDVHLQETPVHSSLALSLEGEGPASVPACG